MRIIRLDQTHYLKKILDRLNMRQKDKHRKIEISMNEYDILHQAESYDQRIDQKKYQHVIESLMYAVIHIRSDIVFFINRLSQYLSDSVKHHQQRLKHLIRYIRSTIDLDIVYESRESTDLLEYSDSDYAVDAQERRLILKYAYTLAEDSISWMSRKQKSVAIFITEAEYMIISTCAKKDLWLTQILRDLNRIEYLKNSLYRINIKKNRRHESSSSTRLISIQLKKDNQTSLFLVKNAQIHDRSKHIDVIYHNVRNLFKRKIINVKFVSSHKMLTDDLTKSLSKKTFKRFIEQLDMMKWNVSESLH